ncbi:MAG: LacI family DNA-binding transcriptional regulator [Phycicoccus sp.]
MPTGKVTIRDVSRAAGVSVATVSKALSDAPHIAAGTRARVRRAADELGYAPNRAARSLPSGRTHLIAHRLYPDPLNAAMDLFVHAVVDEAGQADLEVVTFAVRPGESELDAMQQVIRRGGVDGFVLTDVQYDDPRVSWLVERGVPAVAFGDLGADSPLSWVESDGGAGTRAAVEHLVTRGHTRIAYAGLPGGVAGDSRFDGWRGAVAELLSGTEPVPAVREEFTTPPEPCAVADELVAAAREHGVTALVAATDVIAIQLQRAAKRAGLSLPDDLAVVGFDDIPAAAVVEPALTTVRQPLVEIGRIVVRLLERAITDPAAPPERRRVIPELVVRDSA